MQSSYLIDKLNYKSLLDPAIKEYTKLKDSYYSINNMGSIFNGFINALVVSNFIFNDLLTKSSHDKFIANFLDNTYKFSNF